jgi:hypothetical protein
MTKDPEGQISRSHTGFKENDFHNGIIWCEYERTSLKAKLDCQMSLTLRLKERYAPAKVCQGALILASASALLTEISPY